MTQDIENNAERLAALEREIATTSRALRQEFLATVPMLTSAEIQAHAAQSVDRWCASGQIFAVHHEGQALYPAFQFDDEGQPLAMIAEVLTILNRAPERTDWDNALWFDGPTGWLDGRSPIECLQSDPEGVKRAAEQEVLREIG
jgi:hypothetical protein